MLVDVQMDGVHDTLPEVFHLFGRQEITVVEVGQYVVSFEIGRAYLGGCMHV